MTRRTVAAALTKLALFACLSAPLFECRAQVDASRLPVGDGDHDSLVTAVDILKNQYVKNLPALDVSANSISGLLRAVDPEAGEYMSKADIETNGRTSRSNEAEFGLTVQRRQGSMLLFPVRGGAAHRSGAKAADVLVAVNGQSASSLSSVAVDRLISETKGDRLVLTVQRSGERETRTLTVSRDRAAKAGAFLSRPSAQVVMLTIPSLFEDCAEDSAIALQREWVAKPYRAVILDLRGNPGGLLSEALAVAAVFVPYNAVIVSLRSESPLAKGLIFKNRPEYYSGRDGKDPLRTLAPEVRSLPLAVLVDEGTASGAEIVAASIQDHERATLIGRTTAGTASIQTVVRLPNGGAIRFTSAYWEAPSGRSVHGTGVRADVPVLADEPGNELAIALARLRPQTEGTQR